MMLVVLLSELEKPESCDVACDCVPSVLESSSEDLCRSSTLGTARMVELARVGDVVVVVVRGDKEEVGARGAALPSAPPVGVRDMAELMVPWDAGVRVERGEDRSCRDLDALAGVGFVGVAAGAVSGETAVTEEGPWGACC